MKKSDLYIIKIMKEDMRESLKILTCIHSWKKSGHGYKCQHCKYYTGMNTKLNKMIQQEGTV